MNADYADYADYDRPALEAWTRGVRRRVSRLHEKLADEAESTYNFPCNVSEGAPMDLGETKPKVHTTEPFRAQGVMRFEFAEDLIPPEHPARALWDVLGTLDLVPFTLSAKALEGLVGRPVHSVRMLLTLWLYAVATGIGSARRIARLVETDPAFRWIVGDVKVSHHLLSQFRAEQGAALDKLMTELLAVLMAKELISLERVAQDGTRVRAGASAPSFRSETAVAECREQAALHVKAVLAEADDAEPTLGEKAARTAAALAYQKRVEAAGAELAKLKEAGKDKPRASTTDAEARVMKMADGGYRPAYNVQLAVAGEETGGPRTIVGVQVTNVGSDMSSVTPMLEQIKQRTGALPETLLADANHAAHACIDKATELGVEVLIPVPKREVKSSAKVSPAVAAWKERMTTPEAKKKFRARSGLCELANAQLKGRRGLGQFLVRGLGKVTNVALMVAIGHNLVQHAESLMG